MSIRNLERLFDPDRIAVIGASPNPESVSGRLMRNVVGGFRGAMYPVNPAREAVLGIPCLPDLASCPHVPDLAVICTAAGEVPDRVRECGEFGIAGVVIISAGFSEIGAEGRALEERIELERRRFPGMRILGPNCLGFINPRVNLNLSFAEGMPQTGDIAFISQSGALCSSVLDWAIEEKIGFSYFVSIGNMVDVDFADLIDFFGEDERTRSIILYIESIRDARAFMTAARAFARTKPIVAYRAGRHPESAAVAASHTGALASQDDVFAAAFERAGIARVRDIGEIFDVADLIGRRRIPRGPRLGIVTNAGGPGVMAVDALIDADGELAVLSEASLTALNENLPPMWSGRNPVDVLGDARPKRIAKAAGILLADPGVDAVLVIITPQAMTNPTGTAREIARLSTETSKPILGAWLGGRSMREGVAILNEAGVASYTTPEQAVRAFMTLVGYSRSLESLYQTPKDIPVLFTLPRDEARVRFDTLVAGRGPQLTEAESKEILDAYGIPVTPTHRADGSENAVAAAERVGYPVVLKVDSPDLTHKSDIGGVALDLTGADQVRTACERILKTAAAAEPQARISGVTVQPMMRTADGIELIFGLRKDPLFGTVIMAGRGGTGTEIFGDRRLGLPPLNERLARRMLESLTIWPLLTGHRGRPPVAIEAVIEALIRLSYLAADYPEIVELDINPLLATREGVTALDARILLDPDSVGRPSEPFAHLALRPYPEEYVRESTLPDGTRVILRPIRPEDEPMWFTLLRSCSPESLYQRFRYHFHWDTHEVASRYCFIDYDREIAIVSEIEENGERFLTGVGRLVADPDHQEVEYAVLVADAWQNRGLGGLLTDYCYEIAGRWGLKRMVAWTTTDNPRMIGIFRKRGFEVVPEGGGTEVRVTRSLSGVAGK